MRCVPASIDFNLVSIGNGHCTLIMVSFTDIYKRVRYCTHQNKHILCGRVHIKERTEKFKVFLSRIASYDLKSWLTVFFFSARSTETASLQKGEQPPPSVSFAVHFTAVISLRQVICKSWCDYLGNSAD